MTGRVPFLLTALALIGFTTAQPAGTDPNDEEINFGAFFQRWNISGDEVAEKVATTDSIEERGQVPSTSGPGQSIFPLTVPLRCDDGPITAIFRKPRVWYWPAPTQRKCIDRCPKGYECVATKTATRQVWAICFKLFHCYGVYIWAPIGIRLLCLTDELRCECKPICKPFFCFPPYRFNQRICDCECPPITCRHPFEQDPVSCQCRCPKDIVCDKQKILDPNTCKCVCPPVKCPPGYQQDPNTCQCVSCPKRCPRGSSLDRVKCRCIGSCRDFSNSEYNCNAIDSCSEYRSYKCRWFPTFPHNRCQCECCQPKPGYQTTDCGQWTPFGAFFCNFYFDPHTFRQPCKWACGS